MTFSWVTVVKPGIVTTTEYLLGGTFRKRNCPALSTVVVCGAAGTGQGRRPAGQRADPCSSVTVPKTFPVLALCAAA